MVRLKEARAKRLLTMAELAEAAGVSLATIRNAEHGRYRPRLSVARKISAALGVPAEEIDELRESIDATARGRAREVNDSEQTRG